MSIHVDVSKRKVSNKKRKYEIAFGAEEDQQFMRPFIKAKRIKMSDHGNYNGDAKDDSGGKKEFHSA